MTDLDDHERALAASFDREHLSVYADHLQRLGDPRGELIAIDLAGAPPELADRRRELIATWIPGVPEDAFRVDHGFIEAGGRRLDSTVLRSLLGGAWGHYVKRLGLHGDTDELASALAALAARPRPWLDALSIIHTGPVSNRFSAVDPAPIIAAMPRLVQLEVSGRRVLPDFPHPNLRRLRLVGFDSIVALARPIGAPMAGVTELVLAFVCPHDRERNDREHDARLVDAMLPALRHLDLTLNEPGFKPPHHGGNTDPFQFLRARRLPALREVYLPSVRTAEQAADLAAALAAMPNLAVVSVARIYGSIALPAVVQAPPSCPWPPLDEIDPTEGIAIAIEREPFQEHVRVIDGVELMETTFATLAPDVRAAWSEFWALVQERGGAQHGDVEDTDDPRGYEHARRLPAITLSTALDGIDIELEPRWSSLRDVLRRRRDTLPDTVMLWLDWGVA